MSLDRGFATLDTSPILAGGPEVRMHPVDAQTLREHYRFCWPGNAPADVFMGVRIVEDAEAPRLPRRPL